MSSIMSEIDYEKIDAKVGLEIHQQLDTGKKLFCNCKPIEIEDFPIRFQRKLRTPKSELGTYDKAALFESSKSKKIVYYGNPISSCLVEQDEEPPHDLDEDAKDIALIIASALNSNIINEIYPMRKTVIDGSNTSGFQRTMLISLGGLFEVGDKKVGVQSICLEEDAAKIISDKEGVREYSLDRLGIPLVEIALDPVKGNPQEIKEIALYLGRLLRATKRVARGLGTIRQDVNVSVLGGSVVEVKGVQQLDQLEKVVDFEIRRQYGLDLIKKKFQELGIALVTENDIVDIFEIMKDSKSKIIQSAIKRGDQIKGIRVRNGKGIFGYSPFEGIRLGREIGQLVRFFGIGGVFHSDELPNYGIDETDITKVRISLTLDDKDGFLIIAGSKEKLGSAIRSIIERLVAVKDGVPAETRLATSDGETVFLRPRPGAARMYPETDIPPVIVTQDELQKAKDQIPKSWDESIKELQQKYGLNYQLSEQVFDSEYLPIFEDVCKNSEISPNFVASVLCSTITNLERKGMNPDFLAPSEIKKAFSFLEQRKISKESFEILFEDIMSGQSKTIEESMKNTSIDTIASDEIEKIIDEIISQNISIVQNQKERAVGPLMGIAMKTLRGKASGEMINSILVKKISEKI